MTSGKGMLIVITSGKIYIHFQLSWVKRTGTKGHFKGFKAFFCEEGRKEKKKENIVRTQKESWGGLERSSASSFIQKI